MSHDIVVLWQRVLKKLAVKFEVTNSHSHHQELVDSYEISISPMAMDLSPLT
jgi:uncharacterized protein YlxP (DUF503 family)